MKPNKIAFATLRAEMARRQIAIIDLAALIGCTRDTMSNWLSRDTKISLEDAILIQKNFFPDMSVWALFEELWNPDVKVS